MTLDQFRILHSTLIEHYQFIESHLEGIYAAVSQKPFAEGIREVERDGLTGILQEIRREERQQRLTVFTDAQETQLRQLFDRRNFWCHSCYFEMVFDRETGGPAKVRDVQQLMEDLEDAKQWRDRLFDKKLEALRQYKPH